MKKVWKSRRSSRRKRRKKGEECVGGEVEFKEEEEGRSDLVGEEVEKEEEKRRVLEVEVERKRGTGDLVNVGGRGGEGGRAEEQSF